MTPTTTVAAATPNELRVIALGDSYTEGTAIEEGRWPDQVADQLRATQDAVDLEVVAGDGWNTKRLSREIARAGITEDKDVVVLAIGANDVVLGFGEENFLEGLDLLSDQMEAMSTPDTQTLVLSIPDFRASPWGQERLDRDYPIERYNELLQTFAAGLGATYVDITTSSGTALGDPEFIADDDLHFSAAMYALWADIIVPEISVP